MIGKLGRPVGTIDRRALEGFVDLLNGLLRVAVAGATLDCFHPAVGAFYARSPAVIARKSQAPLTVRGYVWRPFRLVRIFHTDPHLVDLLHVGHSRQRIVLA